MPTERKEGRQLSLGAEFSRPNILRVLRDLPLDEQLSILAHVLLSLAEAGPTQQSNLPPKVREKVKALRDRTQEGNVAAPSAPGGERRTEFSGTLRDARERFERAYIVHCLQQTHGNITRTAARLGVERSNLHRKIKQYGIKPPRDPL